MKVALTSTAGAALACFVCLLILIQARAQNSPRDYLAPHNAARAQVGVGPLVWDARVAAYAQNYANQRAGDCNLVHSGGPYGENIFAGFGRDWSASDAVASWVSEKQFYDYPSNTCASGEVCGHYTQVVWRDSLRLGCGRVRCNNGWFFIVCSYDPPGNWSGRWPYSELKSPVVDE